MVAKVSLSANLYGALAYNQDKIDRGKGQILETNRVFVPTDGQFSVAECVRDFELSMPPQITTMRGIVHISLNPYPDDKLTDEQLTDIGREYIERMGFGGQPWMIFKHEDIDREHLHIVTTRIRGDGSLISDRNNFEKSRKITDDLERKYDLHPKGERQGNAWQLAPVDVQAGDMKKQVENVIKSLAATYKFHSLTGYRVLLSLYGVGVEKVEGANNGHRYSGLIYSALDGDGNRVGRPLKSSLFGKPHGIEALERLMAKSGEALKTKGLPAGLRAIVATLLANSNTGNEFRANLRTKSIDLVLRYGNGGRLFGTTFIDHNSRTVLNGSALGKDFAANALAERFPDLATESRENKRITHPAPMAGEDVVRSAQRASSDERDRAATTAIFVPLAERTQNVSTPAPLHTDEASRLTMRPTQGDREMAIPRESDSIDRGPDNTDQSLGNNATSPDNTDNHIAIPDMSPIGDVAGSLFSILTPDPGGQTTDNRSIRRKQPEKKKRGRSV